MEFKRLNKNSKIAFVEVDGLAAKHTMDLCIGLDECIILQIVELSMGLIVIELLEKETQTNDVLFERDIEFDNALDTIINNDPFGAKYSGKPIRCIFENGDNEWLDKALNLMHNEFIRKKLEYIVARGGYGKIKR